MLILFIGGVRGLGGDLFSALVSFHFPPHHPAHPPPTPKPRPLHYYLKTKSETWVGWRGSAVGVWRFFSLEEVDSAPMI